jgi:quercetin dioxygenase-like cupin family protein
VSATAPTPLDRRRLGWLLAGPAIGLVVLLALMLLTLPRLPNLLGRASGATAEASRTAPAAPVGPTAPVWGRNVRVTVPFQQVVDRLPEGGAYVFRVTELEMEPGSRIFPHRQLGVGAHVVLRGAITIEDLDAGQSATYRAGQAYFEGLGPLHRAEHSGEGANRVLMVDLLPASRGFDGAQQFTDRGRHNEGELRSGPFVQVPLESLPAEPLMLRVTEMAFGPKAKTVEHTRVGPAIYFVQEGTATVRKERDNSSMTYGTNGYFFESGQEAFILENKPPTPARYLAVELLPASLGDAPATLPTGRGSDDD